jgi:hypothetical protein
MNGREIEVVADLLTGMEVSLMTTILYLEKKGLIDKQEFLCMLEAVSRQPRRPGPVPLIHTGEATIIASWNPASRPLKAT